MVYRTRGGQTSTTIQNSKHIMLTLNGTIANVSKKYESNRSINSGHIPACISADFAGTILWLFSPADLTEFRRKQLLADCFSALKPSPELLRKYVESVSVAYKSGEIDEKKFLFLRSHAMVNGALMNITKGDYARFNERTYIEVYEDIVATAKSEANKELILEIGAHTATKNALAQTESENAKLRAEATERTNILEAKFERKCNIWGWVVTVVCIGFPYVVALILIEFLKAVAVIEFTAWSFLKIAAFLLVTLFLGIFFKVGRKKCFEVVRKFLEKGIHSADT